MYNTNLHWPQGFERSSMIDKLNLAFRYAWGYLGLKQTDVFLSSFPRSGNTWMRFLLCNLISVNEWNGRLVDVPLVTSTMVTLGQNNLHAPWEVTSLPRVVKTHRPYSPLFSKYSSIGMIRDPRDVMVSYYYYKLKYKQAFDGSFSEFIRHHRFGLKAWFAHYASWSEHWDLVIRYEEMRQDTVSTLQTVNQFLGHDYSVELLQDVVERASMKQVRQVRQTEASKGVDRNARFARDGRVAQWPEHFSPQDLDLYNQLVAQYNFDAY